MNSATARPAGLRVRLYFWTFLDTTPAQEFELVSDSPIIFSFHCDDPKFDGKIGSPELGFLSESFAEREATAACLKHWFDLPKSRRDELLARIVAGHDPKTRVELATEARSASGAELYRRLYESIKQGETFKPIDTMPPDVSVLIDHLRIDQAVLPPSSVATPYLNANVRWPACVGGRH